MTLPPEILLEARSKGGEEVVGVHDDMDEGVEESSKRFVSSGEEPTKRIAVRISKSLER